MHGYIKKTLKFNDCDVLRINVKYPDVKILPSVLYQKAEKRINDFYLAAVNNFMSFCEKRLYKIAAAEFSANEFEFKPFGAVITYEVTQNQNQEDFLRVNLDANIFAEKNRVNSVKKSQIWEFNGGNVYLRPIKSLRRRERQRAL